MKNLQKGRLIFKYTVIIHLIIVAIASVCLYFNMKIYASMPKMDSLGYGIIMLQSGFQFLTVISSLFFFSVFYVCLAAGIKRALVDVRILFLLFSSLHIIIFSVNLSYGSLWLQKIPELVYTAAFVTVTVMLYFYKPLKEYLREKEICRAHRKKQF